MFYVYALKSVRFNRIYIGFSSDLNERLKDHNAGGTRSTKSFGPWQLIYSEKVSTRANARAREKQLKSGAGREFIRSLLR